MITVTSISKGKVREEFSHEIKLNTNKRFLQYFQVRFLCTILVQARFYWNQCLDVCTGVRLQGQFFKSRADSLVIYFCSTVHSHIHTLHISFHSTRYWKEEASGAVGSVKQFLFREGSGSSVKQRVRAWKETRFKKKAAKLVIESHLESSFHPNGAHIVTEFPQKSTKENAD